jgi:hypothetical protein
LIEAVVEPQNEVIESNDIKANATGVQHAVREGIIGKRFIIGIPRITKQTGINAKWYMIVRF